MSKKRKTFTRKPGKLRYKKLFLLSVEGSKTEIQYFNFFNDQYSIIKVKCIEKKHGSNPDKVLKNIIDYLSKEGLQKNDEAWIVVDKDQWTDQQLKKLYEWSETKPNYNFALSNPKFEYWLLLHFEDGSGNINSRNCTEKLKKHLPNYNKHIQIKDFPKELIFKAIERAKQKDKPPCIDWPKTKGSTVYKLVESIINEFV